MDKYSKIGYVVIIVASIITLLDMIFSLNANYHFSLQWDYVLTGLVLGLLMVILPFTIMENFFIDLYHSFFNSKKGFSARKLTAFTFIMFGGYIHVKYLNHDNAIKALMIDGAVALLCLGIITAGNIIELRNGKSAEQPKQEENENS